MTREDKFRGVYIDGVSYKASIQYKGILYHIGSYNNIIEAAKAYDRAAIYYYGDEAKLNFPKLKYEKYIPKKARPRGENKYLGVNYSITRKKWKARITIDYKEMHLGWFRSEEEAAKIRDKYAKKYLGDKAKLNFPQEKINVKKRKQNG